MKFYDCTTAPSPRRVRIFLAEKGISVPTVQVDLRNNEQLTPLFAQSIPTPRCRRSNSTTARASTTPSASASISRPSIRSRR